MRTDDARDRARARKHDRGRPGWGSLGHLHLPAPYVLADGGGEARTRSAAGADECGTCVSEPLGILAHLVRGAGEHGLPVLEARQTGVGLDDDRQSRRLRHALHERQHLLGAETAVEPYGRGPGRLEDHSGGLGIGPREIHAAVHAERARDENGQVAHRTHRENRRARLGDVDHGLDEERVRTLCGERGRLFGEGIEHLVEPGLAERLHDEPGRA